MHLLICYKFFLPSSIKTSNNLLLIDVQIRQAKNKLQVLHNQSIKYNTLLEISVILTDNRAHFRTKISGSEFLLTRRIKIDVLCHLSGVKTECRGGVSEHICTAGQLLSMVAQQSGPKQIKLFLCTIFSSVCKLITFLGACCRLLRRFFFALQFKEIGKLKDEFIYIGLPLMMCYFLHVT